VNANWAVRYNIAFADGDGVYVKARQRTR